jgi:hypothetical protein
MQFTAEIVPHIVDPFIEKGEQETGKGYLEQHRNADREE